MHLTENYHHEINDLRARLAEAMAERDTAKSEVNRLSDCLRRKDEENVRVWDECVSFMRQRNAMMRALGTLGEAGEAAERQAWDELESRATDAIRTRVGRLDPAQSITIRYTNYRGETADRCIVPLAIRYAATEWHPEPQWLLESWDVEKGAMRSFALLDFGGRDVSEGEVGQ